MAPVRPSKDLNNWTERTSGTTTDLRAVTYGNGVYVAVGWGIVLSSSDLISWNKGNLTNQCGGPGDVSGNFNAVVYAPSTNIFVADGQGGH